MITIITVCHKSGEVLKHYVTSFLASHQSSAARSQIEFVFVENSGDCATPEIVAPLFTEGFSGRLISTDNRGFGAACNDGAKLANGELLIFVNPDIQFRSDISSLANEFQSNRWGTVRQYNQDRRGHYSFDLFPEYRNIITELFRFYRYAHLLRPLFRYCYPVGSFFVVPASDFRAVGGFDERFFLYYEEAELARRLRAVYGPPSLSRSVSVTHVGFGSQRDMSSTFKHEAKSLVLYSQIIGDLTMVKRRLRMLRMLSLILPSAALREKALHNAFLNQ